MGAAKYSSVETIAHLKEISLLSNAQIAHYLGVSTRAVAAWAKGERVPHSQQAMELSLLIEFIESETPLVVKRWLVEDVLPYR